jgi:hypothetical protein
LFRFLHCFNSDIRTSHFFSLTINFLILFVWTISFFSAVKLIIGIRLEIFVMDYSPLSCLINNILQKWRFRSKERLTLFSDQPSQLGLFLGKQRSRLVMFFGHRGCASGRIGS